MRHRHIAALIVAAIVAAVVTFQAVTHTPPEPYVRLVGRVEGSWIRYECRRGELYAIYVANNGDEFTAQPEGRRCGSHPGDRIP